MTNTELTIGGTEVAKGDTVVCTIVDDGEAVETNPMEITGGYRDAPQLVVGMQGQAVGSLDNEAPIGAHRRWDGEVIGALDLDHEEGRVRDLIDIEVV
jgi:hypothetical protein